MYSEKIGETAAGMVQLSTPWFPNNDDALNVCGNNVIIDLNRFSDIYDKISIFINGLDIDIFKACLPPCLTMEVNMRRTMYTESLIDKTYFTFVAKEEVKVFKDDYLYDIFSLVMDL